MVRSRTSREVTALPRKRVAIESSSPPPAVPVLCSNRSKWKNLPSLVFNFCISGIPHPEDTFNPDSRPDFALKFPNSQLGIRKIPDPEKPIGGPRPPVSQGPEEMCLSLEHQNPSKTSEKMGYFDRVTVSLHIL